MYKAVTVSSLVVLMAGLAFAQPKKGPAKAASAAKDSTPKWKAIWEPVPFNKDIELRAISCAGPETCWVAGAKGTILFTADGGTTWQAQLGGDPEAADEDLANIYFLDAKHGWARSERHRLMGTTDGGTWAELSKTPSTSKGLWFSSPQTGFVADNYDSQSQSHLNRSGDGGKTWTRGNVCSVDAVIDGLSRKLGCIMHEIQFVSPAAGFMGGGSGGNIAVIAKTTDGGGTWTSAVIPTTKRGIDTIHFWSENDGLVLLSSGQTFWTADGGATWAGSVNPPGWRSFYASGQGKIVVGVNENGRQIGYSFDGGRSFTARNFSLPALVRAVTFPDATHGYLVGQHGMVYRYRIVPFDYNSQGMLAAAAAPVQ